MTDPDDLRCGWLLFQTPPDSEWDGQSGGLWTVARWHPGEYSNVDIKRGTACLDGTAHGGQTFLIFEEALACLRLRVEGE